MLRKYSSILLLSFSILFSCAKRNENYSFTARVVEYGSGDPIAEAGVLLHYWESTPGFGNGFVIPYDSVITNQEGYFFVDGTEHSLIELKVYTKSAAYFDSRFSGGIGRFHASRTNPLIELKPIAWLRLIVDYSVFKGKFDYVNSNSVAGCGSCTFSFNRDTILPPIRVLGNRVNSISMFGYDRSGKLVERFQNDSIYCPGFDTTEYTIRYE